MPVDPRSLIRGVTYSSLNSPDENELLLVIAKEKSGKSTLATTLWDFPEVGDRPLVIAFDKTGPDSCAQIGYEVPNIKVANQPGADLWQRSEAVLANLHDVYVNKGLRPYSTIFVDCASTQAEGYWSMTAGLTNPLQRYGFVLEKCREFLNRLTDLGVPVVYVSWLAEPYVQESGSGQNKSKKQVLGGPQILGNFKGLLAGKALMILYMEKIKALGNDPAANSDGYKRIFHTKTHNYVEAGGRRSLPDPMQANLGLVLAMIRGMVENPALKAVPELQR